MTTKRIRACCLGITFFMALTLCASDTRGVFLRTEKPGAGYDIEVIRGGKWATVPVTFRFQSGDKFRLRMALNQDGYVYVLNRGVAGDPDAVRTRDIRLMAESDAAAAPAAMPGTSPYQMVYPATGHKQVKAGPTVTIPASGYFEMDEKPGVEKVYLVVSPRPLGLEKLIAQAKSAPTADSGREAIARLNRELVSGAENSDTEVSDANPRGIEMVDIGRPGGAPSGGAAPILPVPPVKKPSALVKPDKKGGSSTVRPESNPAACISATTARKPEQPYLAEITLAHYPAGQ